MKARVVSRSAGRHRTKRRNECKRKMFGSGDSRPPATSLRSKMGVVLIATVCRYRISTRSRTGTTDTDTAPDSTGTSMLDADYCRWQPNNRGDGIPKDCLFAHFLLPGMRTCLPIPSHRLLSRGFAVADRNEIGFIICKRTNERVQTAAEVRLFATNVAPRQIDLSCKVLTPGAALFLVGEAAVGASNGSA